MQEPKALTEEDLKIFEELIAKYTLPIEDVRILITEIRRLHQIINRAYDYVLDEENEDPDLILVEILKAAFFVKKVSEDF